MGAQTHMAKRKRRIDAHHMEMNKMSRAGVRLTIHLSYNPPLVWTFAEFSDMPTSFMVQILQPQQWYFGVEWSGDEKCCVVLEHNGRMVTFVMTSGLEPGGPRVGCSEADLRTLDGIHPTVPEDVEDAEDFLDTHGVFIEAPQKLVGIVADYSLPNPYPDTPPPGTRRLQTTLGFTPEELETWPPRELMTITNAPLPMLLKFDTPGDGNPWQNLFEWAIKRHDPVWDTYLSSYEPCFRAPKRRNVFEYLNRGW